MQTKPDCITAQDPDIDQSFSHQYVAPVELGELVNFEHRNLLDEMEEEEEEEEDYDYNEAELKGPAVVNAEGGQGEELTPVIIAAPLVRALRIYSDDEIDQMNFAKIRIKLRWRTKEDTTKWTIEKCIKVLKEHEGKRRAAVPAAAAAGGPAPGGPAAGGLASGPAAPVAAAPIYLIDSDEDSIDSDPILCVCKKTYTQKGGDMIACSSNNCKYGQWFHYNCIQLNKKQAKAMMEWYCMGCQYHSN